MHDGPSSSGYESVDVHVPIPVLAIGAKYVDPTPPATLPISTQYMSPFEAVQLIPT